MTKNMEDEVHDTIVMLAEDCGFYSVAKGEGIEGEGPLKRLIFDMAQALGLEMTGDEATDIEAITKEAKARGMESHCYRSMAEGRVEDGAMCCEDH